MYFNDMKNESFLDSKNKNTSEKERAENKVESKEYETEAGKITVSWRKFYPESPENSEKRDQAVVFLPGWAENAGDKSLDALSRLFAESAENPAYLISTQAKNSAPDLLNSEAEAVRQFLNETNLKEIILAGYSKGGDKAIDLINLIQKKNPDKIKVKGLILFGPVGLYKQSGAELTKNFIKDAIETPKTKEITGAAIDSIFSILGEIAKTGAKYPKILLEDIKEMAAFNEKISEIESPVILVQGEKDLISSPDKIISPDIRREFERKKQERYEKSKQPNREKENVPYADEREEYLKKKLFAKSPYVKMIIAKKMEHHGLPLLRSEAVVKSAVYLLKRYYREK